MIMRVLQSWYMSPEEETEVVPSKPKRAPRKRAPKVVSDEAEKKAPVKRAPRKRAPKKVVEEVIEEPVVKRKAPTPIASEKKKAKTGRRQLIVITLMILVGVGASAAIGLTDKGTINVEETIAWRNEQERAAGRESSIIPVQNTPQVPDGGLIGMGIGGPIEGTGSSTPATASSTPATASSTEPVGQAPLTNAEAEAAAQATAETPAQ
ncbi:MAG: hypothetical protein RL538_383 [Candidatus Parcubacteria bacterium]|jgi:hypothetical protein